MVLSVLFYCGMTLLGAALAAWLGLSIFTPPASLELAVSSLALACLLALVVVRGGRMLERFDWYARMARVIGELVKRLVGPDARTSDLLLLAVASSIGEESLFRGAIQPGLANFFLKRLSEEPSLAAPLAILVTSVIFAVVHAPLHRDLRPWTVFAFLMSLALGALATWSGSIAAPVLAHFLVNFLNLSRLLRGLVPVAPLPER